MDCINDFSDFVCNRPMDDDLFTVFSLGQGEEVFRGTWDELMDSEYTDCCIVSIDLHPEAKVLICFNLDDEYETEEDDD